MHAMVGLGAKPQKHLDGFGGGGDHQVLIERLVGAQSPVMVVTSELWRLLRVAGIKQDDLVKMTGLDAQNHTGRPKSTSASIEGQWVNFEPYPGGGRGVAISQLTLIGRPGHVADLLSP